MISNGSEASAAIAKGLIVGQGRRPAPIVPFGNVRFPFETLLRCQRIGFETVVRLWAVSVIFGALAVVLFPRLFA